MSKSVTVNFADGTSHVYDNVPDDVSNDQVNQRAQQDFNKEIQAVGAPAETEQNNNAQNFNNASTAEQVMGVLHAGYNILNNVLSSPLGHIGEAVIGGKYLVDKLGNAIRGPVQPPTMPPSMGAQQAAQVAQQATGTYGVPRTPNLTVQPGGLNNLQQGVNNMIRMPQPAQPSVMQQGMDYANKIRQLAYDKAMQGARGVGNAIESVAPDAQAIASRMAPYMKAGVGLGALTYSQPLGPQVPMQGQYRGMEINPMTNRPWTQQELQQINR